MVISTGVSFRFKCKTSETDVARLHRIYQASLCSARNFFMLFKCLHKTVCVCTRFKRLQ